MQIPQQENKTAKEKFNASFSAAREAREFLAIVAARLKSCPDTRPKIITLTNLRLRTLADVDLIAGPERNHPPGIDNRFAFAFHFDHG